MNTLTYQLNSGLTFSPMANEILGPLESGAPIETIHLDDAANRVLGHITSNDYLSPVERLTLAQAWTKLENDGFALTAEERNSIVEELDTQMEQIARRQRIVPALWRAGSEHCKYSVDKYAAASPENQLRGTLESIELGVNFDLGSIKNAVQALRRVFSSDEQALARLDEAERELAKRPQKD